MQGYLTLEEAARTLSIPVDELRQMAQKNQIRSFQDRGTLRFRAQDIQELARQRGLGNSQEEPVVPAPATPPKTPRVSEAGSGRASKKEPTDFSLEVSDEDRVDIGLVPPSKSEKNIGASVSDVQLVSRDSRSAKHSSAPANSASVQCRSPHNTLSQE